MQTRIELWQKPSIKELGPDLLGIGRARRAVALACPFLSFATYFVFAASGHPVPALLAVILLSFLTYGSVSHDLVHANLGLPPAVNRGLLSLLEMLMLRSPILYCGLVYAGSWIIPLVTSYLVHAPDEDHVLRQTRLYRGTFYSLVALDHLYHLEHHLYPQVPHQNWKRLARRLDPYFEKAGLKPNRVF